MIASGVNHADERTRTGEFKVVFPIDLPKVTGGELSGMVVDVGRDVTEFAVGQHVYGYTGVVGMGTWAEIVAVAAEALAPAPAKVDIIHAAALPVVALTAWQSLVEIAQLKPGQVVLVHGGAGGVGAAVIQLAEYLGATVATTVSASSADAVRRLGADVVIDYRNEDFVERLALTPWMSSSTLRAVRSATGRSRCCAVAVSSSASPARPSPRSLIGPRSPRSSGLSSRRYWR